MFCARKLQSLWNSLRKEVVCKIKTYDCLYKNKDINRVIRTINISKYCLNVGRMFELQQLGPVPVFWDCSLRNVSRPTTKITKLAFKETHSDKMQQCKQKQLTFLWRKAKTKERVGFRWWRWTWTFDAWPWWRHDEWQLFVTVGWLGWRRRRSVQHFPAHYNKYRQLCVR